MTAMGGFSMPKSRNQAADMLLSLMRFALGFYVLFFPLGMSLREAGAVTAFVCLVAYYILDWQGSNLRRFPLKWLFFALMALIALKTLHSTHFSASLYAVKTNFYKGPMLLLAGLECVRRPRHLRALAWPFIIMSVYAGLDGIYQYFTKVDFFFGMPESGRLNAMWKTGRIGNLMSLVVPVCFALPALLPKRWSLATRLLVTGVIAFPGLFLWVGAKARSGWFGMAAAMAVLAWLRMGKRQAFAVVLLALAGFGTAAFLLPHHMSLETLTNAPRFIIWQAALDVWREFPVFGAGVNCFEPAYKALGIVFDPAVFDPPIPHPHNIYVQFMAETGLVGLVVLVAFLGGNALWGAVKLKWRIKAGHLDPYLVGACFWASSVGYAVTGLSAHNFYRTWWLGMAMLVTGLALGAALARWKQDEEKTDG